MNLTDQTVKNRFAAACQQFDKENAVSVMELNAALSLRKDGIEPYNGISQHTADMIKRLLDHNRKLQDILFTGEGEIDFDAYMQWKKQNTENFEKVLRIINRVADDLQP